MATVIQDFVFLKEGTSGAENTLSVLNGNTLQLEVEGTGYLLTVEAQVTKQDMYWYPVAILSDKEYKLISSINTDGLYKVDLTGFSKIKIKNISTNNSSCTCIGRVVTI